MQFYQIDVIAFISAGLAAQNYPLRLDCYTKPNPNSVRPHAASGISNDYLVCAVSLPLYVYINMYVEGFLV